LDLISEEVGLGISVLRVVYFTSFGARYFTKENMVFVEILVMGIVIF